MTSHRRGALSTTTCVGVDFMFDFDALEAWLDAAGWLEPHEVAESDAPARDHLRAHAHAGELAKPGISTRLRRVGTRSAAGRAGSAPCGSIGTAQRGFSAISAPTRSKRPRGRAQDEVALADEVGVGLRLAKLERADAGRQRLARHADAGRQVLAHVPTRYAATLMYSSGDDRFWTVIW